ncbi:MAG: hypothetical protein FWD36_05480 [Treponema sp.]|nr:hypothetical protein [Treponema sp.]
MSKDKTKKRKPARFLLMLLCIFIVISIAWVSFALIGRIKAEALIPDSAIMRLSIANPARLIDRIKSHESLDTIAAMPELAQAASSLKTMQKHPLLKNRLLHLAARGNLEFALLPNGQFLLAWDTGLFSPLLRILPLVSGFANVPNMYYVQAGKNSRFEYRMEDRTLFIGPYRNVLFIADSSPVFESRAELAQVSRDRTARTIKLSAHDAVLQLSPAFIGDILAGQDSDIAAVIESITFDSAVEIGLSVSPKKLELHLMAPVSSPQAALVRLLEQRSHAPVLAERLPTAAQYATILSAGTLEELCQAALLFSGPALEESIRRADSSSRTVLGLTLDDLLFSWSGTEFAVFGLEGRPHPVYAIQIADERKRQAIFDRAFKSIALNENVSLNLDGTRLPRIEVPDFLQSLLRHWDIFMPSPYYTIHKGYLLASESADTLLASLRAMQRNDVLPRTAAWRNIAGGKAASSAFSLYYSLDLSMPFFLRNNTVLSGFLGIYRQGLVRMSFDKGLVDISLALIPGAGGGVTLMNNYPLAIGGNPSNQIYGAGKGEDRRIFLTRGNAAISINPADNSVHELAGQGPLWVIPAEGVALPTALPTAKTAAWVVSAQGRVTLVDGDMRPMQGFPALTGVRLSAAPAAWAGRVFLCCEDEKVHVIDENGRQSVWESSFPTALRSPPSFLSVRTRQGMREYAAVYPKSFFGEIWLLDLDGRVLPNWPVPVSAGESSGIAFGSPLLFAHNNRVHVAFVTQDGELSVFDGSAAFVQPFPVMLDGVFYQQPVFDGEFLWLISAHGTLFQVSLTGEVLYQHIAGFAVKEEGYITVFDSDGGANPAIFMLGEGNALHGYSRHFRSLEGFPLPVWGRPLFVGSSGNEKAEIIGLGMDRRLYRWQFR